MVDKALELLEENGDKILKKHSKRLIEEIGIQRNAKSFFMIVLGWLIGGFIGLVTGSCLLQRSWTTKAI